jgi:hypothetical protein
MEGGRREDTAALQRFIVDVVGAPRCAPRRPRSLAAVDSLPFAFAASQTLITQPGP